MVVKWCSRWEVQINFFRIALDLCKGWVRDNPLKIAQVFSTVKIIHVPLVKLDILNERAGAELFRSEVSWSKIYQIGICSFEAQFCHFLAQIWEKSNNPSRGAHDGTLKRRDKGSTHRLVHAPLGPRINRLCQPLLCVDYWLRLWFLLTQHTYRLTLGYSINLPKCITWIKPLNDQSVVWICFRVSHDTLL